MAKNHIKRINAPKRWDILRKEHTFISRPNPGRNLALAVSLNTALKEMIGKTKTTKESKYLIKHRTVLVNGAQRFDEKFPVGFLDVLSLPEEGENYRLIVSGQNTLAFLKITPDDAKLKVSKVANKTNIAGNRLQVNCTDGRNFLMDKKDAESVTTNDAVVYSIPEQHVKEVLKLEKGNLVYLYKGKHIGQVVKIEGFKNANILFKIGSETFETKKSYAFPVGKDKPVIAITDGTAGDGGHKRKK